MTVTLYDYNLLRQLSELKEKQYLLPSSLSVNLEITHLLD